MKILDAIEAGAYLILAGTAPANDNPRRRAAEPTDGERRAPRLDPDRSTMPGACGEDTALHRRAA